MPTTDRSTSASGSAPADVLDRSAGAGSSGHYVPGGRPRSGPHRDQEARLAVLHAADDLLAEHGLAATSIEAIARRAGVAKQTVYRWWPSKVDILLEGLLEGLEKHLSIDPHTQEAGALEDYVHRFTAFVDETPDGRVLLALLGHAQLDPHAGRSLREKLLTPRRTLERELALRSGAAADEQAADDLLDAQLGAVLLRAMRQEREGRPLTGPPQH